MGQPFTGISAYAVQSLHGKKSRILHGNLLLPLQGNLRQEGGSQKEVTSVSGITGVPSVSILLKVRYRRVGTTPAPISLSQGLLLKRQPLLSQSKVHDWPTVFEEDKNQCDTHLPFSSVVSGSESSDEDDVFIDSMTSHTTASDSSEIKSSLMTGESLKPVKSGIQLRTLVSLNQHQKVLLKAN